MTDLIERLDEMETAIRKPSFRQSSGRANEVNYWVFDYPPERELEVRERIEYLKNRNVNDWDIREGFPHEIYGLVPVKYWKRVLVCFFINGVSGVIFRFSL